MLVLGINCCLSAPDDDFMPDRWPLYFHDAAAAVIRDGEVVAAIEQERLNRIKHTTAFAGDAAAACLALAGAKPGDLDRVAYFFDEHYTDSELYQLYAGRPDLPLRTTRQLLGDRLRDTFGAEVPDERLRFVRHHDAHAWTAWPQSGYDAALVVVMDGSGEYESLSVYSATGGTVQLLTSKDVDHSLGLLYLAGTELLGYGLSDEYKVMGLAPHGDPARYRGLFDSLVTLEPDGDYALNFADLQLACFRAGFVPRRRGEPFTAAHRDFAAALQQAVERVAWHVIAHWQRVTGHRRLALAGGVGQNCTFNGQLLRAGCFDDVFVHPAAHDAGSAAGAALLVDAAEAGAPPRRPRRVRQVFWGRDLPDRRDLTRILDGWAGFCRYTLATDVVAETARRLADGQVVGWVHGRAEFGPRALGHRSILADPRPESNRDRVNLMVKSRETYRPFAPSVQAERLWEFFGYPQGMPAPEFMVFTVPVLPEAVARLGAVTHVDGTARVHAVHRDVDPRFWRLLGEFAAHTGVPVLLNTSFNNHAEPIVDSVDDAVRCFLTTGIDCLVIDDLIVTKLPWGDAQLLGLAPRLMPGVRLRSTRPAGGTRPASNDNSAGDDNSAGGTRYELRFAHRGGRGAELDPATAALLGAADGATPARVLAQRVGHPGWDRPDLLRRLWCDRLIDLRPPQVPRQVPHATASGLDGDRRGAGTVGTAEPTTEPTAEPTTAEPTTAEGTSR